MVDFFFIFIIFNLSHLHTHISLIPSYFFDYKVHIFTELITAILPVFVMFFALFLNLISSTFFVDIFLYCFCWGWILLKWSFSFANCALHIHMWCKFSSDFLIDFAFCNLGYTLIRGELWWAIKGGQNVPGQIVQGQNILGQIVQGGLKNQLKFEITKSTTETLSCTNNIHHIVFRNILTNI